MSLYEVMYTERYMDTPSTNKAGDKSKVGQYLKDLKASSCSSTAPMTMWWSGNSLDVVERSVNHGG
ncbi:MAG: hypothetical protein U0176_08910 [Bacteroidia bacterium]